jgi:hypothetical protein
MSVSKIPPPFQVAGKNTPNFGKKYPQILGYAIPACLVVSRDVLENTPTVKTKYPQKVPKTTWLA